jgi:CRISPR-associated exonuclease Cas4
MIPLAFLVIIGAFVLLWWSARLRRSAGISAGRVISADTSRWGPVEKPLYDPLLNLTGRPDYLVSRGAQLIPVEVKSHRASRSPFDSHIYQLAAYCLLVQHVYRKRPPYGILHYPNRTFAVDYTPELEQSLLDVIAGIRIHEGQAQVNRSHQSPARCRGCGFREVCDQRLD